MIPIYFLYAGTEGGKATEIVKEMIAEPKATVDANITFSNAAQPLVYRFDLQKAGENWVVVRWERLTNSR